MTSLKNLKAAFHLLSIFYLGAVYSHVLETPNALQAEGHFESLKSLLSEQLWQPLALKVKGPAALEEKAPTTLFCQAEENYFSALYNEAIGDYLKLRNMLEDDMLAIGPSESSALQAFLVGRLGQAYYFIEDYDLALYYLQKSASSLMSLPPAWQKIFNQNLYLLSLAYRQKDRPKEAIAALHTYLSLEEEKLLPFFEEAQFELGLNHFYMGSLKKARKHFATVPLDTFKKEIYLLAQLYIGRIALAEKDFLAAEKKIKQLEKKIAKERVLIEEFAFIQGELAFYKENYAQALLFFEASLPALSKKKWHFENLHLLGWSYTKLADDPKLTREAQHKHFEKALAYFHKLTKLFPQELSYLDLAQCYLLKYSCLQDEKAWFAAEEILFDTSHFVTKQAKAKALLLRAEFALSYETRQSFFRQLTHDEYSDVEDLFAKGWFLQGLNEFNQGQALIEEKQQPLALKAYKLAAISFQRAFSLLSNKNAPLAEQALKFYAKASLCQQDKEALLQAWHTLFQATEKQAHTLIPSDTSLELHYLQGHIALKLALEEQEGPFIQRAELHFLRVWQESADKTFVHASLNALGTLYIHLQRYEEAERLYLQALAKENDPAVVSEALHWSAYCGEKLKRELPIIKGLRQRLYDNYPTSPFAPLAYFQSYSLREYLQGDSCAMKHLQKFKEKFPDSPLLIHSFYLLGLDYKRDRKNQEGSKSLKKAKLIEAIHAFNACEKAFDRFYALNKFSEQELCHYAHVRFQSLLERGLANQAIALEAEGAKREIFLQYAEDVLVKLTNELKERKIPYIQAIGFEEFPLIQQEGLFALLNCYIQTKNFKAAHQVIETALENYERAKIHQSYYLARFYSEKGILEMAQDNYALALSSFVRAEESDKGKYLSVDERLNLWIALSSCYKNLNQIDKAMLILSKVINHRAISGLRIKAMYLRAEMYMLQGRPELARKQFEATAKKGGKWAEKAKDVLATWNEELSVYL